MRTGCGVLGMGCLRVGRFTEGRTGEGVKPTD